MCDHTDEPGGREAAQRDVDRELYDWGLARSLASPQISADRIHYARLAVRTAPTPGTRHFAKTQYRAAIRAYDRDHRKKRPLSKDLAVIAITLPPSILLGSLTAWLMGWTA